MLAHAQVPNHTATQQDLKRVLNVSPSSCSSACSTLQPLQKNHITSPRPENAPPPWSAVAYSIRELSTRCKCFCGHKTYLLHTDYCTNTFLTHSHAHTHTAMRWSVLLTVALLPPSLPLPSPLPLQKFPSKRLHSASLTVSTQRSFSQAPTTSGMLKLN